MKISYGSQLSRLRERPSDVVCHKERSYGRAANALTNVQQGDERASGRTTSYVTKFVDIFLRILEQGEL